MKESLVGPHWDQHVNELAENGLYVSGLCSRGHHVRIYALQFSYRLTRVAEIGSSSVPPSPSSSCDWIKMSPDTAASSDPAIKRYSVVFSLGWAWSLSTESSEVSKHARALTTNVNSATPTLVTVKGVSSQLEL